MFDIEATLNLTFEALGHNEGLLVNGSDELRSKNQGLSPQQKLSSVEPSKAIGTLKRWCFCKQCIQCIQCMLMWLKVCTASQLSPIFQQSFTPIPPWLVIWVEDAVQTHGHASDDGQRRHLQLWKGRAWIKRSCCGQQNLPGKASVCLVWLKPLWCPYDVHFSRYPRENHYAGVFFSNK